MSRLKGMFGGQAKHINIDNSVMAPPMSAAAFTAASDSEDSARTSSSDGEYEAAAAPTSAPASRSNSHSTIASALASASAPAAATKKSQAAVARSNSKSKGPASPLLNPVVSNKSSTSLNLQCQRVHMLDDQGHHEHVLRSVSRRQEKLRNMFGELMGNGKKVRDDAVSAMPELLSAPATPQAAPDLSLISGFVRRVEAGKLDPSAVLGKPAPTNAAPVTGLAKSASSASLLEKYGKCQGVIGRGAYGVVRITQKFDHKSRCEKLFAIKEFKRKSEEDPKNFANRLASEFCISSSLHHVNIIQTLDLMKDFKGECCQVMEYCEGGDLYSLILASEGGLTALEADCFFKQICRGVVYIHSMGVAHCDLKPENILLTKNGCVKITDFGNGECFRMAWEKEIHMSTGVCGSRPYIAPEQFRDAEFDPRPVDIWAIGVIYMAMRTGSYLWQIAVPDEDKYYREYLQGRKHQNGYRPIEQLPRSRCRNVIYSILDPYPNRRITGKQILNSEWGRSIVVCDAGEKATE